MVVKLKIDPLTSAQTALTDLATAIDDARIACIQAAPSGVSLDMLWLSSTTGRVPQWLRDQAADPIGMVLDLARLLDLNSDGKTQLSGADGETLEDMRVRLGELMAERLESVDENDRQAMVDASEMLSRYGNDATVMGAVTSTLGQGGTLAVLNRARDLEVDLADAMGQEGQKIVADWVADDIEGHEIDGETTDFLEHFHDDVHFSRELFHEVTPDEFGDAIHQMSNDIYPPGGTNTPDAGDAQIYADFLDYAGASLATYSNAIGTDTEGLTDQWFDAITGDGTDDLNSHPNPENAAALTLLIKRGGQIAEFDDQFLGDLTNQVYDWERSFDGDPVWGPLNEAAGGGSGYGVKEPHFDYGDTTTSDDNMTYSQSPFDGLANLLSGMEKSPEAAERFFTYESDGSYVDQVGYNGEEVNEKLLYLMRDRQWPTDDGDGFGVALQHATTHSRDEGDPDGLSDGDRAARLASQTVFVIANEVGRDDDWHDDGWQIPEGMRDSVGYMLSAYAPDIQRISLAEGDDISGNNWVFGDGDGEGAYHDIMGLAASNSDLAAVLQAVGRGDDKEGITAVLTSQIAHHENLMNDALSDYNERHPNAPKTMDELMSDQDFRESLFTIGETNGTALEYVLSNGVDGGADGERDEAARREALAKAFSIGTSFLPGAGDVLGETASHLAKSTYDAVSSEALGNLESQIGAAPENLSEQWSDSGNQEIQDGLSYGTYNAFLNAGYLDPDVDPDHGVPPGVVTAPNANGYVAIDPALYDGLENDDDVPADVRNAFHAWLLSGGAPHEAVAPMLNGYSSKVVTG